MQVGLIGAGRIAQIHAKTFADNIPEAQISAVADISPDAARKIASRYGISHVHSDYKSILENSEIEAVLICSTSNTHAQFIKEAAEAQKHIFCEKPIALELEKIDEALEAVKKHQVKLQIGFQRRFDPSFKRAREVISSGDMGEIRLLRITSRDPMPAPLPYLRESGGIFLDMSIHDFDMARYLVPSEVEEVYAVGGVMVDPAIGEVAKDIDTALITLRFRNGVYCSIDNCRQCAYGYDQRIEWFGSGGKLVVQNKRLDSVEKSDEHGLHSSKPLYFYLERYQDAYREQMRSFVDALIQDTEPLVTGIDGEITRVDR